VFVVTECYLFFLLLEALGARSGSIPRQLTRLIKMRQRSWVP
jgi:hypothetical protein